MSPFAIPSLLMLLISVVTFLLQAYAFIDATTHRADAYPAIDKGTKPAWLIGLGLGVAAHMLFWSPLSLLNLIGYVGAIVYLVEVRPKLQAIVQRRW